MCIYSKLEKTKNMKYIYTFLLIFLLFSCGSQNPKQAFSVVWEMGENQIEDNHYECTFYLINQSADSIKDNWAIFFNQQPAAVKPNPEARISVEQVNATYYKMRPTDKYQAIAPGDTVAVTYRYQGSIMKLASAPEGAYCVWLDDEDKDIASEDLEIKVIPFNNEKQWSRKGINEISYPYGEVVYADNELFTEKQELTFSEIFPSVKEVANNEGKFVFSQNVDIKYDKAFKNEADLLKEKLSQLYNCTFSESAQTKIILKEGTIENKKNEEHYLLRANENTIEIVGENTHAIFNGTQSLLAILGVNTLPYEINNFNISDYPDLAYRGFMLDVARNFTNKQNLLKLIDLLASYKISVLHMHLTDDEGWRIEIPGLEELTTVGATRGHTYDELETMFPAYGGGWDSKDKESVANGFYTRQDFIDILHYANQRHIKVIPEIDLPGHARAAIKAMNTRYYKYIKTDKAKAEEYLLADFNDTSIYLSAQSYRDNTINVAKPSAYTFVRKVVDEVAKMYTDAGLKLEVFHLGGDEVPKGAWTESDICKSFMKEKGMTEIRELKDYFIEQTISILKEKGLQMGAWQEVALLPDESINKKFINDNVLSYCWNTLPDWGSDEIPYRLANAGYPIILSNVTNFYFDLSYNKHEDEPGAYWAGFVDEYKPFNVLPYNIYYSVRNNMNGSPINLTEVVKSKEKLQEQAKANIKGVQAQLWAETIRNYDMVEHYIFPKLFGLVERGWNTSPSWNDNPLGNEYTKSLQKYNAKIGEKEMPVLARKKVNFRVPLPGVKIENRLLLMNHPIAGAKIYYTTDGSIPTEQSTEWLSPIPCDAKTVRAKAFYEGRSSATTLYQQ